MLSFAPGKLFCVGGGFYFCWSVHALDPVWRLVFASTCCKVFQPGFNLTNFSFKSWKLSGGRLFLQSNTGVTSLCGWALPNSPLKLGFQENSFPIHILNHRADRCVQWIKPSRIEPHQDLWKGHCPRVIFCLISLWIPTVSLSLSLSLSVVCEERKASGSMKPHGSVQKKDCGLQETMGGWFQLWGCPVVWESGEIGWAHSAGTPLWVDWFPLCRLLN